MSLRKKMAKGALWSLLEQGGASGMSFIVFSIVARLIGPEEYGLVNLCYVYLSLAWVVLSGMVDGVINLDIRDDRCLSTLFWATIATGVALGCIFYAAAGPFATIMGMPRLVPLLRWFSLMPILLAFSSVPTVLVSASMNFRIFAIRTLVASLVSGIIGIAMAYKGFGAYAIVAQQIALYFVINLVIWPGAGWRPRLMFDSAALIGILKPGLKMTGSSFVAFLEQQVPRLLIGSILGPVAVGYFAFVSRIRLALQDILVYPLSVVLYPAFARIRDDHGEQKKILGQLIIMTGTLVFPAIAGAIITAPMFVPVVFGKAWEPAVGILQLFLLTGATLPFFVILRDLMRAHNRTGAFLRTQFVIVGAGLLLTLALVFHGLILVSWGLVIVSLAAVPVYTQLVARKIKIRLWRNYWRLWAPLAASALMAGAVYAFDKSSILSSHVWLRLLLVVALGGVVYGVACFIFQFRQMMFFLAFVKKWWRHRSSEKEIMERTKAALLEKLKTGSETG